MERLSIFDIYKIGVGPSSSHTLGPWKAGNRFAEALEGRKLKRIEVHLYGSLSKTGKGHGTDLAVQLGLEGYQPETIPTEKIREYIQQIRLNGQILINGQSIPFLPAQDIVFHNHQMPVHPNTLTFKAFCEGDFTLEYTYYSTGGGFISREGEAPLPMVEDLLLDYPIDYGRELIAYTEQTGMAIWEIVQCNERCFRTEEEIEKGIDRIFNAMLECVFRGCNTDGILPGGLLVKRRAKALYTKLTGGAVFSNPKEWIAAIQNIATDFGSINKWISCFALAVNEENAALGRVVTSPTNGAAGVIPAVLFYYYCFCNYKGKEDLRKFLFTSGEIGCIFKKRATISAAMGGCQAEIGVSSAMAAAGLTELMGGTPKQVLMAAEIAMEHHLGLTCDPIGGLVQIPCIERNTMGAIKAITASNLALDGNPDDAIVNFDLVVKTMWDTAMDMSHKYKETSEGGLAYNLPVMVVEC